MAWNRNQSCEAPSRALSLAERTSGFHPGSAINAVTLAKSPLFSRRVPSVILGPEARWSAGLRGCLEPPEICGGAWCLVHDAHRRHLAHGKPSVAKSPPSPSQFPQVITETPGLAVGL